MSSNWLRLLGILLLVGFSKTQNAPNPPGSMSPTQQQTGPGASSPPQGGSSGPTASPSLPPQGSDTFAPSGMPSLYELSFCIRFLNFPRSSNSYFYQSNPAQTCEAYGITSKYECETHHRQQLLAFKYGTTIQESTDAVPNKSNSGPLPVNITIKFNEFLAADSVNGFVNIAVEISMYWRNSFIGWDITTECNLFDSNFAFTQCPSYDVYSITWNPDVMWVPDFQLSNDQIPFDQGFPSNLKAVTDYAGGCNYVLEGTIEFSCNFAMTDFPFDTQSCQAVTRSSCFNVLKSRIGLLESLLL